MISLLNYLDQSWEGARGYLREDLEHIQTVFNRHLATSSEGVGPPGPAGADGSPGAAGAAGANGVNGLPGALVLLEQFTANNSATLDFTASITSAYDDYVIEFLNVIPATSGAVLWMRMSTNAGVSYDASAIYDDENYNWRAGGSALQGTAGTSTKIRITQDSGTVTTAADGGITGRAQLYRPLSTTMYKRVMGFVTDTAPGPFRVRNDFFGAYESVTAVNAIRFLFSSGNITSGTIRVYGVSTSNLGTTGAVWGGITGTLASQTDLQTALDAKPSAVGSSVITSTGNQTALALPTGTGDLVIYCNNASLLTIQGIAAGLNGQRLTIRSINASAHVSFTHEDAAATATNRLTLCATVGTTSLFASVGFASFRYDGTRWRLDVHEQGAPITPTYAAGNFTATVGTWGVDAGDVASYRYFLRGRILTVWFDINTSTTTGSPGSLILAVPGGYAPSGQVLNSGVYLSFIGITEVGYVLTTVGIGIYLTRLTNVAMPNLTNTLQVDGTIVMHVQ